tara:strand:+ start:599 stop:901 length:303 start_codon:yes stop_codon:yes gene_type:complete
MKTQFTKTEPDLLEHVLHLYSNDADELTARKLYWQVRYLQPDIRTPEEFDQWDAWRLYIETWKDINEVKSTAFLTSRSETWRQEDRRYWEQQTAKLEENA